MTKLSKRTKRISTAVAVVAIVGTGAGAAYAYWTSTGTGEGSGTTGTSTAFTVAEGGITGAALTPGGPSQSIAFTVTNPNSGNQSLSSVVVTVAGVGGATWNAVAGCSAADYAVGTPVIAYGVIGPSSSLTGSVTVTMLNSAGNQDACRTVAYPLHFAAS